MVQNQNQSIQPVVDANVTAPVERLPNLSCCQRNTTKHIQVNESALSSMEFKIHIHTINQHFSQIIQQYF